MGIKPMSQLACRLFALIAIIGILPLVFLISRGDDASSIRKDDDYVDDHGDEAYDGGTFDVLYRTNGEIEKLDERLVYIRVDESAFFPTGADVCFSFEHDAVASVDLSAYDVGDAVEISHFPPVSEIFEADAMAIQYVAG